MASCRACFTCADVVQITMRAGATAALSGERRLWPCTNASYRGSFRSIEASIRYSSQRVCGATAAVVFVTGSNSHLCMLIFKGVRKEPEDMGPSQEQEDNPSSSRRVL